jgi:quercetin dioxygenase-like cupin family protein
MKFTLFLFVASFALAQSVTANLADAKWVHDKGDPPGAENVFLRQDPQTGGMELLLRFPAGHVFAPHWHSVNERILVLEGKLTVKAGAGPEATLEPGGFAFLPAKEVQHLACVSKTRCTFYISWDGRLDNHKAE